MSEILDAAAPVCGYDPEDWAMFQWIGPALKQRAETRRIIVHCSATPPSRDIGAAEIDRWHRQRGFLGLGYHAVIRRSGAVEAGRPLGAPGAHAQGANRDSVGVCLVGGIAEGLERTPEENFTVAQWASLRAVVSALLRRYPDAALIGHRDLPKVAKACPCFDVAAWWREGGGQ